MTAKYGRRNEPNLARLGQGGVFDGERCETNPIPGRVGCDDEQTRKTNPIARSGAPRRCRPVGCVLGGAKCAKRSQFLAMPAGRGTSGKCAKQSQTRASWGIWGTGRRRDEHRANAPNKPNLPGGAGGAGRGMLYKQSQFPPDQKEGQVLGAKGFMVNTTFDKPQQNKANLGEV